MYGNKTLFVNAESETKYMQLILLLIIMSVVNLILRVLKLFSRHLVIRRESEY